MGLKVPIVEIKINGINFKGLVDTGSSVTYCRASTVKKLKLENSYQNSSNVTGIAANGSRFVFLGELYPIIEMGRIKVKTRMLVSEDKNWPTDIIIGIDFLRKINEMDKDIKFDLITGQLIIDNEINEFINTLSSFNTLSDITRIILFA